MRKPLVVPVAVVGALLAGGAVTGSTLAKWQDTATVDRGTMSASEFAMTADNAATAHLGTMSTLPAGQLQAVEVELQNTTSNRAKNLRVNYYLDSVTSSNSALNGALEIDARAKPGGPGACTVATTGFKPVGAGYTSTKLTATIVTGGKKEKMCLTVRLPASAPASAQNQTGTLTFTFGGRQVRP